MVHFISCFLFLNVVVSVNAFVPRFHGNTDLHRINNVGHDRPSVKRYVAPEIVSSLIIATIDADIANIPTNEFAPIFAGGIAVMFGGLFSALAVGFIIDKRDLYANIVADSYAQGADDAEFWKGLSDEEKKKTQELLQRIRESKEDGPNGKSESNELVTSSSVKESTVSIGTKAIDSNTAKVTKDLGMFSDYGDE